MKIITSWDDGNKLDFKIAELLKKYDLPGIFFIPNSSPHTNIGADGIKKLSDMGFEIGGHTKTHPRDLKQLSKKQQIDEICFNKGWLAGLVTQDIDWFCYPRGRYNDITVDIVKSFFKYARTTLVGYNQSNLKHPGNSPYRHHPTIHVRPDRKEYQGTPWLEYAKKMFDHCMIGWKNGADIYYHVWGHSWEIEKYGLWDELEELFKYITNK